MTERRKFAEARAQAFTQRTLGLIGEVLDSHSQAVIDYACEMQDRLDAAEKLLAEFSLRRVLKKSTAGREFVTFKVATETLEELDKYLVNMKARQQ